MFVPRSGDALGLLLGHVPHGVATRATAIPAQTCALTNNVCRCCSGRGCCGCHCAASAADVSALATPLNSPPLAAFLRTRDLISKNVATCNNEETHKTQGHVVQQEPAVALCATCCILLSDGRCLLLHDTSCLRARIELPLLLSCGAACGCPACLPADASLRANDPQSWPHSAQSRSNLGQGRGQKWHNKHWIHNCGAAPPRSILGWPTGRFAKKHPSRSSSPWV